MLKGLAQFAMKGLPQAVLVSLAFSLLAILVAPLGIVAGAIIALVVLKQGSGAGMAVMLLNSAGLGVATILMGQSAWLGFGSGIVQWLPVIGMALLLRSSASWGQVLQAVLVVGLALVAVIYLFIPDVEAFWLRFFEVLLSPAMEQLSLDQAQLQRIARAATGLMVAALALNSILTLMLGRSMQAGLYNPGGFATEFQALRIGQWPSLLSIVIVGAAIMLKTPVLTAMAVVITVVFVVQGFAVIHGLIAIRKWPGGVLIAVYLLLLIFLIPMLLMISGIGMVDAFSDFRRRLGGAGAD